MSSAELTMLASVILWIHVGIILFNVLGLLVIPIGAWRGWAFVRIFWWRALHVAVLAIVALQGVFQKLCFLTVWQDVLLARAGQAVSDQPLIERWVISLIFWPLPIWVFTLIYIAAWIATLVLWRLVPPRRRAENPRPSGEKEAPIA